MSSFRERLRQRSDELRSTDPELSSALRSVDGLVWYGEEKEGWPWPDRQVRAVAASRAQRHDDVADLYANAGDAACEAPERRAAAELRALLAEHAKTDESGDG
ncbi:hypothetical protein [Cellulomonas fimi]|uniref:Uncharacterized protein n=1 Tax=Cellulomonas fimi TaxID=1708 RepID=A0A7Y0QHV9_CELFI|nr:hypothetical protein [Cellulomonas fimi]NMR21601.1 hypothetical protein [Cellulomonas fimi]